ncbi:MAG: hypothetical protein K1X89_26020, partial [Myxococcaceae bacterium]|nr:hypothetical protein [Myxococcaceae bacterium]
ALMGAQASPAQALADKYGVSVSSPGQRRFLAAIATLDAALTRPGGAKGATTALVDHDARRDIFHLEALFKVYGDALGPAAEPLAAQVKGLEDLIGATTTFSHALKLAKDRGAPPEVSQRLRELQSAAMDAVEAEVAAHWLPGKDGKSPAVATLLSTLNQAELPGEKKDRKLVAKWFTHQAEKIGRTDYAMDRLGDGVHALRRKLRWLVVTMESLDGLVQVGPARTKGAATEALVKKYPSTLAPAQAGEKTLEVPADVFAQLQAAIADIGEIKDDAEARELLESAARDSGASPDAIDVALGPAGSQADMTARATVVRDGLRAQGTVAQLAAAFGD